MVAGFAHVPDYKCIVPWLEKSAAQGNPDAQLWLSMLYSKGDGVKQDHVKAQELGKLALAGYYAGAKQRDAHSMRQLSMLVTDRAEKAEWTRKSAEAGEVSSMMQMAEAYATGNGVEQNYTLTDLWLHKAAETGGQRQASEIADFYYAHRENETNRINALIWSSKVGRHMFDGIAKGMTKKQISEAERHIHENTFPKR